MHGPRTSGRFGPVVMPFWVCCRKGGKVCVSIRERSRMYASWFAPWFGKEKAVKCGIYCWSMLPRLDVSCTFCGGKVVHSGSRHSLKDVSLQVLWIDGRLAGVVALLKGECLTRVSCGRYWTRIVRNSVLELGFLVKYQVMYESGFVI